MIHYIISVIHTFNADKQNFSVWYRARAQVKVFVLIKI